MHRRQQAAGGAAPGLVPTGGIKLAAGEQHQRYHGVDDSQGHADTEHPRQFGATALSHEVADNAMRAEKVRQVRGAGEDGDQRDHLGQHHDHQGGEDRPADPARRFMHLFAKIDRRAVAVIGEDRHRHRQPDGSQRRGVQGSAAQHLGMGQQAPAIRAPGA